MATFILRNKVRNLQKNRLKGLERLSLKRASKPFLLCRRTSTRAALGPFGPPISSPRTGGSGSWNDEAPWRSKRRWLYQGCFLRLVWRQVFIIFLSNLCICLSLLWPCCLKTPIRRRLGSKDERGSFLGDGKATLLTCLFLLDGFGCSLCGLRACLPQAWASPNSQQFGLLYQRELLARFP